MARILIVATGSDHFPGRSPRAPRRREPGARGEPRRPEGHRPLPGLPRLDPRSERCDRPKRRTVALRASVGSTEATADQSASVCRTDPRWAIAQMPRDCGRIGSETQCRDGNSTHPQQQQDDADGVGPTSPTASAHSSHVPSTARGRHKRRRPRARWVHLPAHA